MYKALRDITHLVDKINTDESVIALRGISSTKQFREPTSNLVGVSLDKYKVVGKNVFAFDQINTIRVNKVPIALNETNEKYIISPAYTTFVVNDEREILPKYLFLWFSRKEFDREGMFNAIVGVRGSIDLEDFFNCKVNVPSIEEQRRIVNEYQTVERRIRNNEALIQKLEETAQAIYYHTFVEGIDEENLPEGWRKGVLSDLFEIKSGGTPSTDIKEYWQGEIPLFSAMDINGNFCFDCLRKITRLGLANCSSSLYGENTVILTARGTVGKLVLIGRPMAMNQSNFALLSKQNCQFFLYLYLNQYIQKLVGAANGAVFSAITLKDFDEESIVPSNETIIKAEEKFVPIFNYIKNIEQENNHLRTLLTLLTSRLS